MVFFQGMEIWIVKDGNGDHWGVAMLGDILQLLSQFEKGMEGPAFLFPVSF